MSLTLLRLLAANNQFCLYTESGQDPGCGKNTFFPTVLTKDLNVLLSASLDTGRPQRQLNLMVSKFLARSYFLVATIKTYTKNLHSAVKHLYGDNEFPVLVGHGLGSMVVLNYLRETPEVEARGLGSMPEIKKDEDLKSTPIHFSNLTCRVQTSVFELYYFSFPIRAPCGSLHFTTNDGQNFKTLSLGSLSASFSVYLIYLPSLNPIA